MLILIVSVFFCCWGPKFVLNVMKKHQTEVLKTEIAFYASVSKNGQHFRVISNVKSDKITASNGHKHHFSSTGQDVLKPSHDRRDGL
jgi:hypothetical protein